MKSVLTVRRTDTAIIITAPYNREFVNLAHKLAGRFADTDKTWHFDIRDEADVLEACYFAYGEDGVRNNKCDVQISLPDGWYVDKGTINFFGRPIARAFNRDSGAKVFDGVLIKQGGFGSGGSMRHWTTRAEKGTVIQLRDLSLPLVQAELENGTYPDAEIKILNQHQDLVAERARLLARLTEIDAQMEAENA